MWSVLWQTLKKEKVWLSVCLLGLLGVGVGHDAFLKFVLAQMEEGQFPSSLGYLLIIFPFIAGFLMWTCFTWEAKILSGRPVSFDFWKRCLLVFLLAEGSTYLLGIVFSQFLWDISWFRGIRWWIFVFWLSAFRFALVCASTGNTGFLKGILTVVTRHWGKWGVLSLILGCFRLVPWIFSDIVTEMISSVLQAASMVVFWAWIHKPEQTK